MSECKIFLWSLKKGKRGFHISANPRGCAKLASIASKLPNSSQQEVTVALSPTIANEFSTGKIPMARSASIISFEQLEMRVLLSQEADIEVYDAPPKCLVSLSASGATRLEQGMADIAAGRGDWAIVGDKKGDELWFWPL